MHNASTSYDMKIVYPPKPKVIDHSEDGEPASRHTIHKIYIGLIILGFLVTAVLIGLFYFKPELFENFSIFKKSRRG